MPRQLNQYLHFGRYLARRFIEDNCIKNAAALTYTTLFAVVPVMTVAYAMLAAIPAFDQVGGQVEAFIFKNFLETFVSHSVSLRLFPHSFIKAL